MSDNNEREWLPLELIKTSAEYLEKKGIPTPRLDAEVLLCSVLDCTRVKLYTIYDEVLSAEQIGKYREMIRRRVLREPVSRILGKREFMGFDFIVTPDVLSPRPDTEILVEKVIKILEVKPKIKKSDKFFKEWDKKNIELIKQQVADSKGTEIPQAVLDAIEEYEKSCGSESNNEGRLYENSVRTLLDLGTGSGCIPISIVKHVGNVKAVGVDISPSALSIAQMNAESLGVLDKIEFIQSDFFQTLDINTKFDIIVSNPPYLVKGDESIWPEVTKYDPELALYAENNGLACYRSILHGVKDYLNANGVLLLELGAGQLEDVSALVHIAHPDAIIESLPDHSGIDRVMVVRNICGQ